ncbi:DUF805 domain-containing protein [Aquimarina agarivorans]|uniref:DUF805 domain-containing protein n=1 Tax=Aquimarina agarivorans TaxID=980584 RepID=UPI000248EDD4|nr:DUF805 domain-containing protein [Aquimarina agarivorans]
MEWYLKVLKQYVDFNGRARRKEYWMFTLISTIISYIIVGITYAISPELVALSYIYSLAVALPSLAVVVRRLHDIGKSGWFFLIILIPLIGAIWLIVLLCQDSEPGPNEYGPNPKNPDNELDEIGVTS